MSYIRSQNSYCYSNGQDLVLNTNHVVQNGPGHSFQYRIVLPPEEFYQLVRRIIEDVAPGWARDESHLSKVMAAWQERMKEFA